MPQSLPIVYHPDYVTPLPEGHRFPMGKFRLLHDRLWQLGIARAGGVFAPQQPPLAWLQLVHGGGYVAAFCEGRLDGRSQRRIGLPWTPGLVNRSLIAVGGTILTAELALRHGLACNTAGGTHHAFPDYGSGFCIFNDVAIAARLLLARGAVARVLVVDLDVHQGDGTAVIFQGDPRVFTFSMHCEANFPGQKQASDRDVSLPAGLDDDGYLQILAQELPQVLDQSRPDLVFYNAGVDPHSCDRLGKLCLSDRGLYRRDRLVLSHCWDRAIPVAAVIGGGYDRDLGDLVARHSLLHQAAGDVFSSP